MKLGDWIENLEIDFYIQLDGRAVSKYLEKWSYYLQSALEIRGTISPCDLLPEPTSQSTDTETNLNDPAEFDSHKGLSTAPTSQQDNDFIKPGRPNTRVTNSTLKQQLQQQHAEARAQGERLINLFQQREAALFMRLELQRREEAEQQRKELTEQIKELLKAR